MNRTYPTIALATFLTAGLVAPARAASSGTSPEVVLAQWGRQAPRGQSQQSYAQGFRVGVREGQHDARERRPRDYRQHSEFRRGSGGWGNNGGSDDAYRRGFAEGYLQGYDRARGGGYGDDRYPTDGYPNDGYPNRGYPDTRYPGQYGYPGGGGSGYPGGGYGNQGGYGYSGAASQRGFQDGYKEGRDAGRDNDRYDAEREKKYREGDDGYNSRRDGSRDQYKNEYRNAFRQGYDRGYREAGYR